MTARHTYAFAILCAAAPFLIAGCAYAPRESACGALPVAADGPYFDWLTGSPFSPVFQVLDTESSLGPYAEEPKTITLTDLVNLHGHPCDGLVTAACGLSVGFKILYPDGVIDRTDTGCITNNSPCFGDAASYLTGGRIRFGTQKVDPGLGNEFILYRFSTREAVRISLKPGVFPEEVLRLERTIRAGNFTIEEMRRCQELQWEYARELMQRPPDSSFDVERLPEFEWIPDVYEHQGKRGDIINRNVLREKTEGIQP